MMDDKRDYLAAFAIGAIVGVGATLLLAPSRPTGARRLLHELEPRLRRARKKSRRLLRGAGQSARRRGKRVRRDFADR